LSFLERSSTAIVGLPLLARLVTLAEGKPPLTIIAQGDPGGKFRRAATP